MRTKPIFIILAALLVLGLSGAYYLYGVARGAKILIVMSSLSRAATDLKKQGSFTNDVPQFCDIHTFTDHYSIAGTDYQCVLAAKSPLFRDRGFIAITTNDELLWIDNKQGPIKMNNKTGPPGL